ncbi:MFS transporter [Azohydromonas caseinilytica]|uniref:MFS transporter n=1 Tax=Azohydromonas caseinilytica TaxID=2728836 RepID=A0A848FDA5_9BURK|nr:MFS transporter [Azohydromonas caseinilytica]NML16130.1 MFS transporter [Azohydromonas caseinilytica]
MPLSLDRPVWAVRLQFFVSGFLFATWGVHVPTVRGHYGLNEQALALTMLAAGIGALCGLAFAGRWVGRWGPQRVALLTGMGAALSLTALLASQVWPLLLATMWVFGAVGSIYDVAMNAGGSALERVSGRRLMSRFHALFSFGGMAGAAFGSALLKLEVAPVLHLALVGAASVAAVLWATRPVLPAAAEEPPASGSHGRPRGVLWVLGVLAAIGLVAEGAMYDWSVLYMQRELGSAPALSALAYASFSVAMGLARLVGDAARARWPAHQLMTASALLAAAGMAAALLGRHPALALLCFALVGLGLANVIPVLFAAASRLPGVPAAQGIATVSSLGYLGFMGGPPVIGFIAQHRSLTAGLATVVVFSLLLALVGGKALRPVARVRTSRA